MAGIETIRMIKEQGKLKKVPKENIIAKVSEKKKIRDRQEAAEAGDDNLAMWFAARRIEMKGRCAHCGGLSCKEDDQMFHFSIAHILPKAYFSSVATHPLNWIELCFWGDSCHTLMDNKILDMTEMNCWDLIVERFQAVYPYVAKEERRRIPELLKNYIY